MTVVWHGDYLGQGYTDARRLDIGMQLLRTLPPGRIRVQYYAPAGDTVWAFNPGSGMSVRFLAGDFYAVWFGSNDIRGGFYEVRL